MKNKNNNFKYLKEKHFYYKSYSNNGLTCVIGFYDEDYCVDKICNLNQFNNIDKIYSIVFAIGRNRKQVLQWMLNNNQYISNSTIKNGNLEYLIFAYNSIQDFENFIKEKYPTKSICIYTNAESERKYNIYRYYLKRIKYKENKTNNIIRWNKSYYLYKILDI